MAFGFFKKKKKKELHYDPTNIGVMDIRRGFIFEFDGKTWEATEEYEYDWGDNDFTYEFKVVSENETYFLSVEEDDEIECIFSQKIPFSMLDDEVEEQIIARERAPKKIYLKGTTYYRDEESPGHFRDIMSESWQPFVSWTYYDDAEENVLTVEQWGERDFEASLGVVVNPSQITNILPIEMDD